MGGGDILCACLNVMLFSQLSDHLFGCNIYKQTYKVSCGQSAIQVSYLDSITLQARYRLSGRPCLIQSQISRWREGAGDDKKTHPLLSFLFIVAHPLSTNFYPSQAFVGAKIKDHSFNFHQENTEHLRLLCRLLCYVTQRSNIIQICGIAYVTFRRRPSKDLWEIQP